MCGKKNRDKRNREAKRPRGKQKQKDRVATSNGVVITVSRRDEDKSHRHVYLSGEVRRAKGGVLHQ